MKYKKTKINNLKTEIMEKKKLGLQELKIESFVTKMDKSAKDTVNGGALTVSEHAIICATAYLNNTAISIDILEATVTIGSILVSIQKSNAGTNCAGATRTNCDVSAIVSAC